VKVQVEAARLRLRVTRAELDALRQSKTLRASLEWPGGGWAVEVACAADTGAEATAGTLRISLAAVSLDALAARLPARDGIREILPFPVPIELRFEVDLHDGRRPR
jgi:hypothetical protein